MGAGLVGQRFFLKRRLFPVSFRASFREVWTTGAGCVRSVGEVGRGAVGQADPKGAKSPEMWLPEDESQEHDAHGGGGTSGGMQAHQAQERALAVQGMLTSVPVYGPGPHPLESKGKGWRGG